MWDVFHCRHHLHTDRLTHILWPECQPPPRPPPPPPRSPPPPPPPAPPPPRGSHRLVRRTAPDRTAAHVTRHVTASKALYYNRRREVVSISRLDLLEGPRQLHRHTCHHSWQAQPRVARSMVRPAVSSPAAGMPQPTRNAHQKRLMITWTCSRGQERSASSRTAENGSRSCAIGKQPASTCTPWPTC